MPGQYHALAIETQDPLFDRVNKQLSRELVGSRTYPAGAHRVSGKDHRTDSVNY